MVDNQQILTFCCVLNLRLAINYIGGGINMRKITDFIVKGRYVFLLLFIVAAVFSIYLSTKVNINDDIMKYLPETSETKIGKDIMDEEFAEQDSSTLNVMFQGLSDKEKEDTLKKLQSIEGVSSVDYENTEEYNKDQYTLYVLNVDDYDHSETATHVYNYVNDNFKIAGISGSIYEENKPVLQLWIVILAIACGMIILIILSESYLEPWLYLISIGIAVFINKGTNIMFDSVSSITNSIVAILQLALSMDYSIMLSNRYKQEKLTHSNKIEAMKEALYHSFKAILSSSVTTIVGLIALVFMSFTIGKDLGFVLAKGVLLSLISIFFCLPALLLIFDNLIAKTKKKAPKFNLTKLGNVIYKSRYVQLILIVVFFVGAYLIKGNIGILYTDSEQDKVGKVFEETNQIAIVYNNKYENLIANYCKKLEKDENIDQTLCYSNTINEKLAYDELNKKFKDLGQDTEIEEYLIKLIYYHYYNKDENNKMTLNEFVSFIKSDIYTNDDFSDKIDQDTRENLELLENFTTSSLINKKRSTKEIADILGMNEKDAENILIYYNSKNLETKMTIKEFVDFMLNDVANDKEYSSSLDSKTISKLKQLQKFTDVNNINKKMNASELSSIFGIEENLVDELFLLYDITKESTTTMTLQEFASFATTLSNNPKFSSNFSNEEKELLPLLLKLSNDEVAVEKTSVEMKEALQELNMVVEDDTINLLYTLYTGYTTNNTLTLVEFTNEALGMASTPQYRICFTDEMKKELNSIGQLHAFYQTAILSPMLFQTILDSKTIELVKNQGVLLDTTKTPQEWITIILENNELVEKLKIEAPKDYETLQKANYVINNFDTRYTSKELAEALKINPIMASVVYGEKEDGKNNNLSLEEIICFLYQNKDNPLLQEQLTSLPPNQLSLAYQVITNRKTPLSYQTTSNILGIEVEKTKQIFGVYDYTYQDNKMTPVTFTNFILENQNNENLKGKISKADLSNLMLVKKVMIATLNNTKYTATNLSSLLNIDNNTMSLLYSLYNSKYIKDSQEISLYNLTPQRKKN